MASRTLRSATGQKSSPQAPAEQLLVTSATPTAGQQNADFEQFVRGGIAEIKSMLEEFKVSLEFQAQRTTSLEQRVDPLEKKVTDLEKQLQQQELLIRKSLEADNKQERFSRKNNFRIVGLKEGNNENPMEMAKTVLQRHFGMENPRVERAHRDGPKMAPDKPRHFLVRMLSYQDKRHILSQQRNALAETEMFIIDDLTKSDREEKKKWKTEVQEAFSAGIRYHFSSGKWRDRKGNLAPFYNTQMRRGNPTTTRQEPPPLAPLRPSQSGQ